MKNQQRLERLVSAIRSLTPSQIALVENVVGKFGMPKRFQIGQSSDLITPQMLEDIGDTLRIHHAFSREPFSKDKFEYALERIANESGFNATLAPRGNPGYDIEIDGERFSLKTEAATRINPDKIHISKFMELGGGQWGSNPDDLIGLRDQFFEHLKQYQRIIVLRKLPDTALGPHYELVEIPKPLLLEAKDGELVMKLDSSQEGAKPGYCYVPRQGGHLHFSLYFDGGGERKLQIKHIDKALCIVHAEWGFAT